LYLIEKAEEEIKELNQKALIQKANIRKNYTKRIASITTRMRTHFIEAYNQFINNSLSSAFLDLRENLLTAKSNILDDLKSQIRIRIKKNIEKSYNSYLRYLLNNLKKIASIKGSKNIVIILNEKDYNHFISNYSKVQSIFNQEIILEKSTEEFIGGFKIILNEGEIAYDYTIDTLLLKNSLIIENQVSSIFSDTEIKGFERQLEDYFNNKKQEIEAYLPEL